MQAGDQVCFSKSIDGKVYKLIGKIEKQNAPDSQEIESESDLTSKLKRQLSTYSVHQRKKTAKKKNEKNSVSTQDDEDSKYLLCKLIQANS